MNKQNAIRHILKKCRKVKTYEKFCEIPELLSDNDLWNIWLNKCDCCKYLEDDFCMIIDEKYDDDREINHCLPILIDLLEKELPKRSENNGE